MRNIKKQIRKKNFMFCSSLIISLLAIKFYLGALDYRNTIIMPPREYYQYGNHQYSIDKYSYLGRQVFRSMQESLIFFNKNSRRPGNTGLKNCGFAEASYIFNDKIEVFYDNISNSSNRRQYLRAIMNTNQCSFVIWLKFKESYRKKMDEANNSVRFTVYTEIFVFDGEEFSTSVQLEYNVKEKSFTQNSLEMLSWTICDMLLNRSR